MNTIQRSLQQAHTRIKANANYVVSVLFKDDRGDTNFVSILILLGIGLALAAVFMVFRDQILNWANSQFKVFTDSQQDAKKSSLTTPQSVGSK